MSTMSGLLFQWKRSIRFLASLKLAVVIIIAIGVVTAWGTIVEARYDAMAAKKLVYGSIWMTLPMSALVVCLIAVMIDRWPWQRRHTGFVLAHIGIIVLIFGSWITGRFGIDGSLAMGMGEKASSVTVSATDLAIYSSMDGASFTKIFDEETDFFLYPALRHPLKIQIPDGEVRVVESHPYAIREQKIVDDASNEKAGAAVRFQLFRAESQGAMPAINVTEWVFQNAVGATISRDLGPAQVVLLPQFPKEYSGRNAIVLRPTIEGFKGGDELRFEYRIYSARESKVRSGTVSAGDTIETGWMGMKFRLLKALWRAREEVTFRPVERPTPMTNSAIRIEYALSREGKIHSRWMGLNSLLKLFSDNQVYIISYGNRRIPLGFELRLQKFDIGRYPGTMRAASYQSHVEVLGPANGASSGGTSGGAPALQSALISMNEPLQYSGYTFYQASFESDPMGRPVASVLSVNRDPGRRLKYFGSLLIVLGALHLFYIKRRAWVDRATRKEGKA